MNYWIIKHYVDLSTDWTGNKTSTNKYSTGSLLFDSHQLSCPGSLGEVSSAPHYVSCVGRSLTADQIPWPQTLRWLTDIPLSIWKRNGSWGHTHMRALQEAEVIPTWGHYRKLRSFLHEGTTGSWGHSYMRALQEAEVIPTWGHYRMLRSFLHEGITESWGHSYMRALQDAEVIPTWGPYRKLRSYPHEGTTGCWGHSYMRALQEAELSIGSQNKSFPA